MRDGHIRPAYSFMWARGPSANRLLIFHLDRDRYWPALACGDDIFFYYKTVNTRRHRLKHRPSLHAAPVRTECVCGHACGGQKIYSSTDPRPIFPRQLYCLKERLLTPLWLCTPPRSCSSLSPPARPVHVRPDPWTRCAVAQLAPGSSPPSV